MKLFSFSLVIAFLIANPSCMEGCPYYYNPDLNPPLNPGSIAGTVYSNGRPIMGQIQIFDPRAEAVISTGVINNSGHFIIQDVPDGEYFLAFLGPANNPIGNFKYVKVSQGKPVFGIAFEITEEDPKVAELIKKIEDEKKND